MLMKRNNTEQVGDVIRQLLRQQGLETPLNEYRLERCGGTDHHEIYHESLYP